MKPYAYRVELPDLRVYCHDLDEIPKKYMDKATSINGLYIAPRLGFMAKPIVYVGVNFTEASDAEGFQSPPDCLPLYMGPRVDYQPQSTVRFLSQPADVEKDLQIADKIRAMCAKAQQFYWSPQHPLDYKIRHPTNGRLVGIGVIAMREPGAFNLTYCAVQGKLDTMDDHRKAIALFTDFEQIAAYQIRGRSVSEHLTMLTKIEFTTWIQDDKNSNLIPAFSRRLIRDALQLSVVP